MILFERKGGREIEALSLLTLRFYPLAFIALTLSTQTALKHRKKGFLEEAGFYTGKNMISDTVKFFFRSLRKSLAAF